MSRMDKKKQRKILAMMLSSGANIGRIALLHYLDVSSVTTDRRYRERRLECTWRACRRTARERQKCGRSCLNPVGRETELVEKNRAYVTRVVSGGRQ